MSPKSPRMTFSAEICRMPRYEEGEHALDMGDIIGDAGYYRLTRSEAEQEYARMKALVEGAEFWYNQRHGKVV